jgi:S-adenosylmethionine hydrolase
VIILFTDFGTDDPYTGQVHAVLAQHAPAVPVIDLLHSAPNYDVRASAYLLAAYVSHMPVNSIVMAVIDPGVGGERLPVVMQTSRRWYVGPDNGLLAVIAKQEGVKKLGVLTVADSATPSFHGRDVFAPAAAILGRGGIPDMGELEGLGVDAEAWPADLQQIIYVDHYGNAITGINADNLNTNSELNVNGQRISHARVFSDVTPDTAFWYCNSNNLVEIAVNQGSAAEILDLKIGSKIVL